MRADSAPPCSQATSRSPALLGLSYLLFSFKENIEYLVLTSFTISLYVNSTKLKNINDKYVKPVSHLILEISLQVGRELLKLAISTLFFGPIEPKKIDFSYKPMRMPILALVLDLEFFPKQKTKNKN